MLTTALHIYKILSFCKKEKVVEQGLFLNLNLNLILKIYGTISGSLLILANMSPRKRGAGIGQGLCTRLRQPLYANQSPTGLPSSDTPHCRLWLPKSVVIYGFIS